MQNGSDVRTFEYNIVEFNKGGYVVDTYTETYVFNPERDIPILTYHCEEFIRFFEENRELITWKLQRKNVLIFATLTSIRVVGGSI